jgi:succinate dehydrogenase / fumarate reductase cytochrome b subunit
MGTAVSRLAFLARVPAALGGLLLVLFLPLHLCGVGLALVAPLRFEAVSAGLHHSPWLPLAELGLLAAALTHLGFSLAKRLANRRAGNTAALSSRRTEAFAPLAPLAALAARSQAIGGSVLLLFVVVHLRQLRWPRPVAGVELQALQTVLAQPLSLLLYVAAAAALTLHLLHGAEAAHRSLGLLDPANGGRIRRVGRLLALLLGGGFALLAVGLAWPGWAGAAVAMAGAH